MDWRPISLTERTEIDANGRFDKYKLATFSVNGTEHTIRISMPDFEADRSFEIQEREANKIMAALGKGTKKG